MQSDWLGLSGLSLGGNYGEATPSDLSLTLTPAAAGAAQVPVTAQHSFAFNACTALHCTAQWHHVPCSNVRWDCAMDGTASLPPQLDAIVVSSLCSSVVII